jgi:hypothetical protein
MQIRIFFATLIVGVQLLGATVSMARQALAVPHMDDQSKTQPRGTNETKDRSKVARVGRDAAQGTKHTATKVGKGGKRAGAVVAEGSEKAANGTVDGVKDASKATAKGAEKTEKATVSGVRKVGRLFKKSGRK